jgi:hypothetical protein
MTLALFPHRARQAESIEQRLAALALWKWVTRCFGQAEVVKQILKIDRKVMGHFSLIGKSVKVKPASARRASGSLIAGERDGLRTTFVREFTETIQNNPLLKRFLSPALVDLLTLRVG